MLHTTKPGALRDLILTTHPSDPTTNPGAFRGLIHTTHPTTNQEL